jgi:aryl-phospho-beta-D-glucosidase BglC (GH1 family)
MYLPIKDKASTLKQIILFVSVHLMIRPKLKHLKTCGLSLLIVLLLYGCGKAENAAGKRSAPSSTAKYLKVDGNKIKYGNAAQGFQEVVLRGVNVGDPYHLEISGGYANATPNYAEIRSKLGANAVRIAVHPKFWTSNKTNVLNHLKGNVQKALAAGLFVIIDYHTVAHPVDGMVNAHQEELYSADFNTALDFWTTIASQAEFSDGRILFELWNEPISADYNYSNTPYKQNWQTLKAKWEPLINIIRANHKHNIIIAAGDHYTFDLRGIKDNLLSDSNTAYAWHIYTGLYNDPSIWAARLDELQKIKPVLVTEWGFVEKGASAGDLSPNGIKLRDEFLKERNLHGFAWAFCAWYTPNMLSGDSYYKNAGDFDETLLNGFGQTVVDYLKSQDQVFP